MTVASAAVAVCRCDGIVVAQRMVMVMPLKWRSGPDTLPLPVRAGVCLGMWCVCVVTALWL